MMGKGSGVACAASALLSLAACVPSGGTARPDTASARPMARPVVRGVEAMPVARPVCPAGQEEVFRLSGPLVQGGLVHGMAPACTQSLTLDGKPVSLAADGAFVIAFDRDAGPQAHLAAVREDGRRIDRLLTVAPGQWRLEHINAALTGRVTSEEFRRRRAAELAQIAAARTIRSASDGWRQTFVWPLTGRISGLFGAQRIYRGTPGAYHGGVDVAARTGTPFRAPADGVVVLAAADPFTLEGHLLIVDHGMGLNSAFLHCSTLAVAVGDRVRQGQVLGTVGATGRATGPHLHWAMKWNDARIDPKALTGPMPPSSAR